MSRLPYLFLLLAGLATTPLHAQPAPDGAAAPLSDQARLDALIRQNQLLIEENARLNALPKTREQAFAACMQAAKGAGAMAAESIGSNCRQLLRGDAPQAK